MRELDRVFESDVFPSYYTKFSIFPVFFHPFTRASYDANCLVLEYVRRKYTVIAKEPAQLISLSKVGSVLAGQWVIGIHCNLSSSYDIVFA